MVKKCLRHINPLAPTHGGIRKSAIGRLSASHNSITRIIDIAMISSLGKKGEIHELVKNYGMVITDECHHGASQTAEEVLNEVNARYVYGLTATPKRDDGQEKKNFMQFGPVRYRYTAKDRAQKQGIGHFVYPRFTHLTHVDGAGRDENKRCQQTCHSEQTQESTDYRRCHGLSGKEKNPPGSDKKQGTCRLFI